ncbi:hypothetical protein [Actinokineospora sp.]|uniref:hypothetical protein n=1 Tax=Actinokineospora sp. TaxID=1872133 RepID=UPI0040384E67
MVPLLSPPRPRTSAHRADLIAAGLALGLVALAAVVGWVFDIRLTGDAHFPGAPSTFGEWPVLGEWLPHVGVGTPIAVLVAVATVAWGPTLAVRLPWRGALAAAYGLAVAWTFALAMIDGWSRGVAGQLTSQDEYLSAVPGITDIPVLLRTFADRILDFQPDSWITHVAGHPPGATLVFVWLDRLGLGGGSWAAVLCVLVGALVAVAVPVTVSALGDPERARAALPFVALFPGAVWMGVSADALFAGVTATGIALLAVSARALGRGSRAGAAGCVAAGVVLGYGIFLSYGLMLMGAIALAVLLAARNWRALALAVPGALAVVAVFALAGFWWLDGYHLIVERYYQGIASDRPYAYWVWADLACLVLAVGPAAAAGLRRLRWPNTTSVLIGGAVVAVLGATLSGLSKAEVERIWLPFAVWLVAAAAFLPVRSHRWWLAGQAATALVVNHLLLTNW